MQRLKGVGSNVVALIVAGLFGSACSASRASQGVAVQPVQVEAGDVFKGETIHATFTLTNETSRAIRLSGIETDCGCSVASDVGEMLEPGQSSDISIAVETDYLEGDMTRTTHVTIDGSRVLTLPVRATVVPEFVPSVALVDFGRVQPDGRTERRFVVTRNERSDSAISAVETTIPGVTATLLASSRSSGGNAEIAVVVEGIGAPGRAIFGNVRIGTTSPYMPTIMVPIRGSYVDAGREQPTDADFQ